MPLALGNARERLLSDEVLIAGAGIGGLTLAAALKMVGIAARVFERAPLLAPVGAGITVQANALLALARLDLDAPVRAAGFAPVWAEIARPSGRVLSTIDLHRVTARVGAPSLSISRPALQEALLGQTDRSTLHFGDAVIGVNAAGGGVEIELASGARARGRLLVGADGLHSRVRETVLGDGAPVYSGYTSWRGVCERVAGDGTRETWGRGRRFGVVPLRDATYWFATCNAPAGETNATKEFLLSLFGDWHHPIRALIEATPAIVRTDIFDRQPLARWVFGHTALLGDAAHPMTPNLGQGGCQAIEDAVVLAEALAHCASQEQALLAYEQARLQRANAVVLASRRLGRVAQWQNPVACAARDALVAAAPAWLAHRQMANALVTNGRASAQRN